MTALAGAESDRARFAPGAPVHPPFFEDGKDALVVRGPPVLFAHTHPPCPSSATHLLAVHVDAGPAPIGIWGEWAGAPARRLADGTLEMSASAPAGLTDPAEAKAEPAFAAPAPIAPREPSEPARSLDSLSAAKRKLLAKRIRGER